MLPPEVMALFGGFLPSGALSNGCEGFVDALKCYLEVIMLSRDITSQRWWCCIKTRLHAFNCTPIKCQSLPRMCYCFSGSRNAVKIQKIIPTEERQAGFLLAPAFLFFAGDDRPVADLLRLDLRLLLFPDVAFLALDLLVVALAPLVLERDDGRRLVRLLVLRFAGVAEDDLERLLEAAALFRLRPRTREGDAMEAPSPTPLVDAGAIRRIQSARP
ncbi:hypothetical protein HPB47_008137 [Ixodes persulcatus]|uniref:Uncharacterized protein n=1 Tax=Ixodes persulcatus TaxID=34615 RepID=A0AC60P5K1_IXOPE|nr:hypothetical protein HPB47_008137 [Ixodes persulcatus]